MAFLLPFSSIDMASLETRRNLQGLCIKEKAAVRPLRIKASSYRSKHLLFSSFSPSAASGEVSKVEHVEETELQDESEKEPTVADGLDYDSSSDESIPFSEDRLPSAVIASLEFYKEALANNDQSKVAELETFFQSIEDERNSLEDKVTSLSDELVVEKDRILRISADFDNFRKRTERERLSLMENVQGEVVENLLPVLDNFERAKAQIKAETEGEEKINSSYQSIYKQFMEILTSLGVVAVETVGSAFDPMLHEAIMREDSAEFEEGIIIQEFRKGFKLGERLLRPSMVKVSAGPGPAKPKEDESTESDEGSGELEQESTNESKEA
ncbi:uncharacterized protein LOC110093414 [Dendrobium catenatum]|uniref:GrpE protein homolog n=1 Tax=Dendrobium catenatum TaxID=906689 RepID=A0A2I0W840_9ASPA|nr:uncharacterized protein LOC110093414 [Dendrobium catenatum]PKU71823.1 hypothetical protein MA16_Dca008352 [Dendrobium catenatum]